VSHLVDLVAAILAAPPSAQILRGKAARDAVHERFTEVTAGEA
jgi:hypothetical protein